MVKYGGGIDVHAVTGAGSSPAESINQRQSQVF